MTSALTLGLRRKSGSSLAAIAFCSCGGLWPLAWTLPISGKASTPLPSSVYSPVSVGWPNTRILTRAVAPRRTLAVAVDTANQREGRDAVAVQRVLAGQRRLAEHNDPDAVVDAQPVV